MKRRAFAIAPIILIMITSSIMIPSLGNRQGSSPPSVHSESTSPSTWIFVNQTVRGTLSFSAQQAAYGIHLDPGQYNITLGVSSAANLGFQVSRWLLGIPTFFTVAYVSPPGVGMNSSTLLLLPTVSAQTPGDYVVRILPSTLSTLGSYWLEVKQIGSFQSAPANQEQVFRRWITPQALLYEVDIPQFGTYNLTLSTNSTATLSIFTYEDDIFLPFSQTSAVNGRSSFLAPLRSGTFYFEAVAEVAANTPLRGSFSINSTSTSTLTTGNTVQGTVLPGQNVYYYANLAPGYYYNITLQVPLGQNLDLTVFSPTTGNLPIATSTNPSLGVAEGMSNLVVFNSASLDVNLQGVFQNQGFQAVPDRVLIGVRNVTVSSPTLKPFSLTLTSQAFPALAPGASANVYLNATTGPYYRFYTSTQTSPAVYNITYQYKVWGLAPWNNGIQLSAAGKTYKLGTTPSTGIGSFYNQHLYFTPTSFQYTAEHWVTQSISNTTFNSNTASRNFTMGIPVFAYMDAPIIIGARIYSFLGHSAYNGTISYSEAGASDLSVGDMQSDFLRSNQISLFKINLKAGHTYRVGLQFSSMIVLSSLYSAAGYMEPTNPPIFSLFLVDDPSLIESGYYYLFTPTVTADYFIVDSGPIFFTGMPDGSYTIQTQEVVPPGLTLTLNLPATQELGHPFNITATITNTGDFEAENVALSFSPPVGLSVTNAPSSWLGTLAPGASVQATWTLNSTSPGNYAIDVQASSSNAPSVNASASLLITAPILQVTITAPASIYPGQSFQVQVSVKNIGNVAAGLTTVQLNLPSGLTASPSSQTITSIAPGQTQTLMWSVTAQSSGDYTITAKANEQYAGSATITASFSVPPPWGAYLIGGVLGSLVAAFIIGVLFESSRERRRGKAALPPPPVAKA